MIGAAAAAASALSAPTVLSTGAAILGTVGAVVQTASALRANEFEQRQLAEQAKTSQENANRSRFRGQESALDADNEAAQFFEDILSRNAASGFAINSGSFVSQQRRNRVTQRLNTTRIRQDAELEAQGFDAETLAARRQSRELGRQRMFTAIGGALNIGSTLIGGATKVNEARARAIGRQTRVASRTPI